MDEEDAYERKDTVILSGEKFKVFRDGENTMDIAIKTLQEHLNTKIVPTDISVLHRLQKKEGHGPDHRDIIVKFCRREQKNELIAQARRNKVQGLYVNEALTPIRRSIAFALRKAKKEFPNIVSGSTKLDGKNFVWVKPPNPTAKAIKLPMHTLEKFQEFCTKTLKVDIKQWITNWVH